MNRAHNGPLSGQDILGLVVSDNSLAMRCLRNPLDDPAELGFSHDHDSGLPRQDRCGDAKYFQYSLLIRIASASV